MGTPNIGHTIIEAESLPSTNTALMEMAVKGCTHGTVLCTTEQTNGRGSRGNDWYSEPERSFCGSVYLNPGTGTDTQFILNMAVALSAATSIGESCGAKCQIKWPNDLLLGGMKAGGILVENSIQGHRLQHVVAGIGVNLDIQQFPPGMNAVSMSHFSGKAMDQKTFTHTLCKQLNLYYPVFLKDPQRIRASYNDILFGKDRMLPALIDGSAARVKPVEAMSDGSLKVLKDHSEIILDHRRLSLIP